LAYKIEYKSSIANDLRKIDKKETKRIIDKIEKDLTEDPDRGTPLKGQFNGLYKYRVGKYRIIYTKTENSILILWIAHRKKAYK